MSRYAEVLKLRALLETAAELTKIDLNVLSEPDQYRTGKDRVAAIKQLVAEANEVAQKL